jgi:hypothetical protein
MATKEAPGSSMSSRLPRKTSTADPPANTRVPLDLEGVEKDKLEDMTQIQSASLKMTAIQCEWAHGETGWCNKVTTVETGRHGNRLSVDSGGVRFTPKHVFY